MLNVTDFCLVVTPIEVLCCTTATKYQSGLGQERDIVRFQVLKAASMKMAVFWVVEPCSLVEVYRCFRDASTRLYGATTQKTAIFMKGHV
jgi:hypothetical protein